MTKFTIASLFFLSLYVPINALEFIESSSGLETPALEHGRTELEMADINNDGNIDI